MNDQPTLLSPLYNFVIQSWRFNRLLTLAAVLHVLLLPFLFLGMVVDPKIVTSVNAWIKPIKFAFSGAIYGFTFG